MRYAALLLVVVAPVLAEETAYTSDDGTWTLTMPADWDVEVVSTKRAVFKLKVLLDGDKIYFYLKHLKKMKGPRVAPYYRQNGIMAERKGKEKKAEIGQKPAPHVVVRYKSKKGTEKLYAAAYRMIRGNGMELGVAAPAAAWPKVKDVLFNALASMSSTVIENPPRPSGYQVLDLDGWIYLLHSGVKKRDAKALHKFVRKEEKEFERVHGKVVINPDAPPTIMVHAKKEDAAAISEDAAKAYQGFHLELLKRRIFAVPLTKGVEPEAYFGSAVRSLLFMTRYDDHLPYWIHDGESRAIWVEKMAGRKHPTLSDGYKKNIPETFVPVDKIQEVPSGERVHMAFCYVLFFEHGPKKYQKAFKACLKDFAETGDSTGALERHLYTLDQEKLVKDLTKFAKDELKE